MCPTARTHGPRPVEPLLVAVVTVVVGMDKAGKASSVHWSDGRDRADQQTKNREHGEQARLHDVLP